MYDIIGDVHGHADALLRLLTRMGYPESGGVFEHETRKAIFVGDFVDRGPDQISVLKIAKKMWDAGTAYAVMGNHEFNAIGWATPNQKGGFLRPHTIQNERQHKEFLLQLVAGSPEYRDAIGWFRRLPLWLDLCGLRVVHACWHEPAPH